MSVENVFIYVADSLRWDHLPEAVKNKGVSFKTVAQSLFSAPSFATLATGRYPPEHGVSNWADRMPEDAPTVFDLPKMETGFWQRGEVTGHAIYPILQREMKTALDDLEPPFLYLERNDDPHVPFGGTSAESAEEYYTSRGGDWTRMRREYETGVEHSVDVFEERLETLADRGVLDDTLVVFTSDHGELFGEHGCAAHGSPASPELAYVPTVFIHPDLSVVDFYVDRSSEVIEHVDVIQTLLSALDQDKFETSGVNLLDEPRPRAWAYNHSNLVRYGRSAYAAESAWWYDGGHVLTRNDAFSRSLYSLHRLTRSASRKSVRGSPLSLLRTYFRSAQSFGTPPVTRETADELLSELRDGLDVVEPQSVELEDDVKDTLEELGYLK